MKTIQEILNLPGKTLLCVGPVSSNVVESAADLSQQLEIPIILIASRRQVDCADFGGGYVNHWTTEQFAKTVQDLNKGNLHLARDHGGPGQGAPNSDWMLSAKTSFEHDIAAGIEYIHIDPSIPFPNESFSNAKNIERLLELYGFVQEKAHLMGKDIKIEIGTEEHTGLTPDLDHLRHLLSTIQEFCDRNRFPKPLFVVSQTGTRVEELKNIGVFETANSQRTKVINLVIEAAKIAQSYSCFLKEHNTDYLSTANLAMRPHIGIKAANVAPEFGVTETRSLIHLMQTLACQKELEDFQNIVLTAGKWKKWLSPFSQANEHEKVLIAGHYSFSDPRVIEIKKRITPVALKKGIHLEAYLRQNIFAAMFRYAAAFGLGSSL